MNKSMQFNESSSGAVIPFVLAVLLILSLLILAIVASIQGPSQLIGRMIRSDDDLIAAESLLQQGRALLLGDPSYDLEKIGLDAVWSRTDSNLLYLSATHGAETIHETWLVIAPTRYLIYSDSGVLGTETAALDGPIYDGKDSQLPDRRWSIDTEALFALPHRTIKANDISGMTVRYEVVLVESEADSAEIILRDIEIDHGLLIVNGNARLEGRFTGTMRDEWPLLVVTGNLSSSVHAEKWQWTGVIGVGKTVFFSGSIDFTGTIAANTVQFFGDIKGSHNNSRSSLVLESQIRSVEREE